MDKERKRRRDELDALANGKARSGVAAIDGDALGRKEAMRQLTAYPPEQLLPAFVVCPSLVVSSVLPHSHWIGLLLLPLSVAELVVHQLLLRAIQVLIM